MNILTFVLAFVVQGVCALPIPLNGTWKQTYSNVYVQSTTEIDWKCIKVYVKTHDSDSTMTFHKTASLHGGPMMVTTPTFEAHIVKDTFIYKQKTYDVHPYSNDTYVITGKDNPSMFVWTRDDGGKINNDESAPVDVPRLTAFLNKLGHMDTVSKYRDIVQTYDDASCV